MQLFIIDRDPCNAANALADCHVRKQILETAQILTAYWVNSGHERLEWMPKPQNYNHPVAKAINQENVRWVIEHFHELLKQFQDRFGKKHKYAYFSYHYIDEFIENELISLFRCKIETFHRMFSGFTPDPGDIVSEYRQYYRWKSKQVKNFKYTNVTPPEWLELGNELH